MKTDAEKGLKLVKFPKILIVHLNRFDYDFVANKYLQIVYRSTQKLFFRRIKLYHSVSFPNKLDLSPFVTEEQENTNQMNRESPIKDLQFSPEIPKEEMEPSEAKLEDISKEEFSQEISMKDEPQVMDIVDDKSLNYGLFSEFDDHQTLEIFKEGDEENSHENLKEEGDEKSPEKSLEFEKEGKREDEKVEEKTSGNKFGNHTFLWNIFPENTYELLSVLVHSGSAAFGHYFAYIKDCKSENWYRFDDSDGKFISSCV
jgi:hypothetical protein